jgi:hypothetical protein
MGDTEEFAAFAHARSQALFRLCCLLVGDRGLAEDLLQESLTKAYVHWRRLRDPAKADAYTRKVITTTAIGWWRRRHGLVVAATAAVVAGAVAIAWGVIRIDRSAGPVGTPFREPRPTYSAGSTIHYGNTIVEAGHQISALIRTDTAFVFATPAAEVFLADGKHVRRIGTTGGRLVAEDTGPYVGWTDSGSYVVYDTAARREVEHDDAGSGPATVVAIDDGNVYLTKADGLHRWNPADRTDDLVARDVKAENVFDVAAGRYAIRSRLPIPAGPTFVVSADPTADQPGALGETADLAPGGGAVVARSGAGPLLPLTVGQRLYVYTTGSFKQVTISHPRYFGLGSIAWLDGDRFTTWGTHQLSLHQRRDHHCRVG